jgi:hypothetical protein
MSAATMACPALKDAEQLEALWSEMNPARYKRIVDHGKCRELPVSKSYTIGVSEGDFDCVNARVKCLWVPHRALDSRPRMDDGVF